MGSSKARGTGVADFLLRHRNLAGELTQRVLARIAPEPRGGLGRLGTERFRFAGRAAELRYRVGSRGDRGVVRQVLRRRDYDVALWSQGRALHRHFAEARGAKPWLVVDAGANIGAATLYFQTVYPGSRVVAVEPEKKNCELLRMNCHGLPVDVLEAALGREDGTLYLQDLGRSDWGFQVGESGLYPVQVLAMDALMAKYAEQTDPFIVKMDIEGAETQLFAGPCGWLSTLPLLVVELHDWMYPGKASSRPVFRRLLEHDFDIIHKGENTFCFNNSVLGKYYEPR